MKKNLFIAIILSVTFVSHKITYAETGFSLGTVSFKTSQTWTIGDQTWSDVVMATGCKKTTFDGGNDYLGFKADCRQNSGYGDLFSWEAVNMYKHQLCPEPWRVPTIQDFVDLDIGLGGMGRDLVTIYDANTIPYINENYIRRWGGTLGGVSLSDFDGTSSVYGRGKEASYWSQSEGDEYMGRNETDAFILHFSTHGINPQSLSSMSAGRMVRCVK